MAGLTVLVVGADGALGGNLAAALAKRGHRVSATVLRGSIGPSCVRLDLAAAPESWPAFEKGVDVAFVAAAITDQKACEAHPDLARRVNVTHTVELIHRLRRQGARVVFPSTNLVLPCLVPDQDAGTPREPIGFYARMKAEVEAAIESDPGVVICRLTKVLTADLPLLKGWMRNLGERKAIRALSDLSISPVSVPYAVDVLCRLVEEGAGGIWQLSGEREISYCMLARELATILGATTDLVACETSRDAGLDLSSKPAHPSLNAERLRRAFGIRPQNLVEVVNDITHPQQV